MFPNPSYDEFFYIQILDDFVKKGITPGDFKDVTICDVTSEFWLLTVTDPLVHYLHKVMSDPVLKVLALKDEISTRIFYDQMAVFIRDTLARINFDLKRSMSEKEAIGEAVNWSEYKRRNGWQALWEKLDREYKEFGFLSAYYKTEFLQDANLADPNKWRRMLEDWQEALKEKMRRKRESEMIYNGEKALDLLKKNLTNIPEYLARNKVEGEEFIQCWGMMGGMWNSFEFERIRNMTALQRKYPELITAANAMGRIADADGNEKLRVGDGDTMPMEHSSHNDIEGISTGRDIGSLLPVELANCVDDELNGLFIYKYLTQNLQTFRSKSLLLKPSKRLHIKKARQKGPMIVCLDTSGSMSGQPERIAHSMLIKLLDIADRQKRDLMLIAFSVSANPIDVKKERAKLLDFFKKTSTGDTDAKQMLTAALGYLERSDQYMNADLMLISDFQIPMVDADLQKRIQRIRNEGTRFYGMQIGRGDNYEWPVFFDRIWHVTYELHRR